MKRTGKTTLIFLLLTVLAAFAGADEISVYAQIGTQNSIYLGDKFSLQIIIDGADKPADVDLAPLEKFAPSNYAGQNISQSSITIINGRRQENVVKRYVMQYQLSASKTGTLLIPPVNVTIDGKTYTTSPLTVNVNKPGTTDKMDIRLELSETACYTGQPITLTINWYIFSDIKNYTISFPGFADDNFYFEDNPGFTEMLAKQARLNISGIEVPAYQKDGLLSGRQGLLVKMQKVIIPKQPGTFDLGSVNVNADLAVGTVQQNSRDRFFDDFFDRDRRKYQRFAIQSEPVTITVKPLPGQNKPDNFYGLVGKYNISTSAIATEKNDAGNWKVSVGEPITLKIKIGPADFLKPVKAPELNKISAFADNFKIPSQLSDPEIQNGYKIFTQTIRAENDTITEIPPVPLTYFDAETGTYKTVTSAPIPIEVTPAQKLGLTDLMGNSQTLYARELERIKQGLSANYDTPAALKDRHFTIASKLLSAAYLPIWAIPSLVLIFSVIYKLLNSVSDEKIIARQKKSALSKSLKQLKHAQPDDYDKKINAMRLYISLRFNKPAHSLTADDCYDIILKRGQDTNLAENFKKIFQMYQDAIYSPVKPNIEMTDQQIIEILKDINKKTK